MLARFFVDRPVFAWVLAIVVMLAGIVAIVDLPIAQYPDVAPPTIEVEALYPGASARTLENSVTQVLEQQLIGLDGLLYFSANSSSAGRVLLQITFEQGVDPDTAQVQVQNKVQQALSRLPVPVQQQGLTVIKSQRDYLMVVVLYDESDRASGEQIADYLSSNVQDPLGRVMGVGGVQVFGSPNAMRIWLDPGKLLAFRLMPADVENAIRAQNAEVSAGQLGEPPAPDNQQLNATITAQSKLRTVEEFEDIVLKYDPSGATVRLRDVARVELGSETYSTIRRMNRHPAAGLVVKLTPGANALQTADAVRAQVDALARNMPQGYRISYARDSTEFIELSIREVVKTLFEAILLVVAVMFVFLQNLRATLIPAVAVPVVLLGTFAVLSVFGYSINTLTLFGLVLSIGLLVDDAIVVVENVERVMAEQGLSPREATIVSMGEITSVLIGIAAVVSAVFLPMAFFGGSTGVIYRQFSITIVASMVLSVLVALVLTPALCASLLKHSAPKRTGFWGWYNRGFARFQDYYARRTRSLIRSGYLGGLLFVAVVVAMGILFWRLPAGFLPNEDQGQAIVQFNLPAGATFERTVAVGERLEDYFLDDLSDLVKRIFVISGFNFTGRGQNVGLAFVTLHDWQERPLPSQSSDSVALRATKELAELRDARVVTLTPSPVPGLSRSAGFELQLQALPGTSRQDLLTARQTLLQEARASGQLTSVRAASLDDTPQLHVDIDIAKAGSLGLSMTDINSTLSSAWGGRYVNDFIDEDRIKRVYVQGDAPFRARPEDMGRWYVRGKDGAMTSFSAFSDIRWTYGPESLDRFNGLPAYPLRGQGATGVSSGAAMDVVERIASGLPPGVTYAFSGLSFQERRASGQALPLYGVSILVVFLCLAALYESWSVPFCVVLVLPLGLVGAALAATLRGLDNDVYFQVALLTTIGLSARNAILIVEFAENAYRAGASPIRAALAGARLRLRPILMTSLSFGAGVLPLALSTGAGANSRQAIGTGILGGTLSATALAIFLVPLFFVAVRRLLGARVDWSDVDDEVDEGGPAAAQGESVAAAGPVTGGRT